MIRMREVCTRGGWLDGRKHFCLGSISTVLHGIQFLIKPKEETKAEGIKSLWVTIISKDAYMWSNQTMSPFSDEYDNNTWQN